MKFLTVKGKFKCINKKKKKEKPICETSGHNCDKNADCVPYPENPATYWCKCHEG